MTLEFAGGVHTPRPATPQQLVDNARAWSVMARESHAAADAAVQNGDELGAVREFRRAEHMLELARLMLTEATQADPGKR